MNDSPVSKKSNPIEQIKNIPSEQELNDSHGSKASTPGFQLRRGNAQHSAANNSNIVGVLRELKDDIVDYKQACNVPGRSCIVSKKGPATGMGDVYVEQNGRFIKAPKELLEHCDFNTRDVYLEEISKRFITPLDIAILVEKGCSSLSRVLLGILAGAALVTLIIISLILDSSDIKDVIDKWPFLDVISKLCQTLFMVILVICLVSMLDWLDLAHTDTQHLIDTLHSRQILLVLVVYFAAFVVFLITARSNDFIIYNMMKVSDENSNQLLETNKNEVIDTVKLWKTLTIVYCILCLVGWCMIALTRNEDLFYFHLLGMKKYEACSSEVRLEMPGCQYA